MMSRCVACGDTLYDLLRVGRGDAGLQTGAAQPQEVTAIDPVLLPPRVAARLRFGEPGPPDMVRKA